MRLERADVPYDDQQVWVFTVSGSELATMRLNTLDRLLLEDCNKDDATTADTLLGLELVARRIEQAQHD